VICPGTPAAPTMPAATCPGHWMPRLVRVLWLTSSTSTSIITSGSARSWLAISFSTMRTASGVSRTTSRLSFSSMNRSRVFTSWRTMVAVCFTSALAR
jgi:hypothetical protein